MVTVNSGPGIKAPEKATTKDVRKMVKSDNMGVDSRPRRGVNQAAADSQLAFPRRDREGAFLCHPPHRSPFRY